MKIFSDTPVEGKINFIDKNNAFVGWDAQQICCEWHGWHISEDEYFLPSEPYTNLKRGCLTSKNIENYSFNVGFFRKVLTENAGVQETMQTIITFELQNDQDPNDKMYLHLYNLHNGYYCHGFIFKKNAGHKQEEKI